MLLKVVYMEVVKCVERQHDRDDIDTPEIFARNIFLLDLDLVREYFHISGTLVRHGRKSKWASYTAPPTVLLYVVHVNSTVVRLPAI